MICKPGRVYADVTCMRRAACAKAGLPEADVAQHAQRPQAQSLGTRKGNRTLNATENSATATRPRRINIRALKR